MHGESIGFGGGLGVTPSVVLAYLVMAGGLFALTKTGANAATARMRICMLRHRRSELWPHGSS